MSYCVLDKYSSPMTFLNVTNQPNWNKTTSIFLNIAQSLINPSQMTHNLSLTFFSVFQVYLKVLSLYLLPAVSNQCRAKLTHGTLSFRDLLRFYQNIPALLVDYVVCSYKWVLWSVNPHQPVLVNYSSSHGKMTLVVDCRYVKKKIGHP